MRVLLVDDDARLRSVIRRLLAEEGIETAAEAGDGQEALALLAEARPDLVLTDCMMPRMDGIAMVRAMRASGDRTPVIMVSSQENPRLVVTAVRAGVDNYVRKPIDPLRLMEAIQQTLGVAA